MTQESEYYDRMELLDGVFQACDSDGFEPPAHGKRVSKWFDDRNETRYLAIPKEQQGFEWVPVPTPRTVLFDRQIEAARHNMGFEDYDEEIIYDDPRLNGATVLHKSDKGYKTYGSPTYQEDLNTKALWSIETRDFVVERAANVKDGDLLADGWEDHSYLEIDVVPLKNEANGDVTAAEYDDEIACWSVTAKIAGIDFPHVILAEFEAATKEEIDEKTACLERFLPGAGVNVFYPEARPASGPSR